MSINSESRVTESGVYVSAPLGGGHVTAKNGVLARQKREAEALGHTFRVGNDIDITKYTNIGPLHFGDWAAKAWNDAQKKGDLTTLTFMTRPICIRLSELLFGWLIRLRFKKMLRSLSQEPTHVVSTQAFCLKSIARAVRDINREKGWHMHLDVYLTDLPSKQATHFFPAVKRLSGDSELCKLTTLHAPKPLEKPTRNEQEFWSKYCGNIRIVTSDPFPIRASFLHPQSWAKELDKESMTLSLKLNRTQEFAFVQEGMGRQTRASDEKEDRYPIHIRKEDKVGFLMLGSQPTTESVRAWLKAFVQARKNAVVPQGQQHYFFLFCGAPDTAKETNALYKAITDEIHEMRRNGSLSEDLHLIPMTFQGEDVIAPLLARSDMTVTRSGGATSMELLQLYQSKEIPQRKNRCTFIHSEALAEKGAVREKKIDRMMAHLQKKIKYQSLPAEKLRKVAIEKLLIKEGIILWEGKNAEYLRDKLQAQVTNPEYALQELETRFFSSNEV